MASDSILEVKKKRNLHKSRKLFSKSVRDIIWLTLLLLFSIPIIMVLFGSFKSSKEADMVWKLFPTEGWHFENYVVVFEKVPIIRSAINGLFMAGTTIAVLVAVSAMCSFIIARRKDKISKFLYYLFIGGLTLPISYIPLIKTLQILHLSNTYLGAILVFISIGLPLNVFLITGFIKTIPTEMDESAFIDGCKTYRLFITIIFPLLKPVLAVATINIFMFVWNNFMIPLYLLGDPKKWTLPMTVYNFFGIYYRDWNLVFADMVVTAIPCLLILLFAQKYLVEGVIAGAVKG